MIRKLNLHDEYAIQANTLISFNVSARLLVQAFNTLSNGLQELKTAMKKELKQTENGSA